MSLEKKPILIADGSEAIIYLSHMIYEKEYPIRFLEKALWIKLTEKDELKIRMASE